MMSSIAIVTSAGAGHASSAEVASAETSHVRSAEVTSAETAHVTSAEATLAEAAAAVATAATTATATATTTVRLCTRRQQRPGKQGGCQYLHRSSSHRFSFRRAQPLVIIEFLALASYGHAARNR